jgi:hypothetical protein
MSDKAFRYMYILGRDLDLGGTVDEKQQRDGASSGVLITSLTNGSRCTYGYMDKNFNAPRSKASFTVCCTFTISYNKSRPTDCSQSVSVQFDGSMHDGHAWKDNIH